MLEDPGALVPTADPDDPGEFARFRAACSRFVNGDAHRRRREFLERRLAEIDLGGLRTVARGLDRAEPEFLPVATLARVLGFREPDALPALVRVIAAAYPDGRTDDHVDTATAEALTRAPRVEPDLHLQLLVQASSATAALARGQHPPVPSTRRVLPDGTVVVVPLDDIPFGTGPRRCPAREIAELLAAEARS